MHWKTRKKIINAIKLYATTLNGDSDKCHEIRIQLPKSEYILIDLEVDFPKTFNYLSLKDGGFNYTPEEDESIIKFGKSQIMCVLNNSVGLGQNNSDTINEVVKLVNDMKSLR